MAGGHIWLELHKLNEASEGVFVCLLEASGSLACPQRRMKKILKTFSVKLTVLLTCTLLAIMSTEEISVTYPLFTAYVERLR